MVEVLMADEEKKEEQISKKEEQAPKKASRMADAEKLRHKKITEDKFVDGDLFYFGNDEWLLRHIGSTGNILKSTDGLPDWGNANDANIAYSPAYYTPTVATILGHFTGINNAMANFLTHAMFTSNGVMVRTGAGAYSICVYTTTPGSSAYCIPRADSAGHLTSWVTACGAIMDDDFTSNGLMYRQGAGSYTVLTTSTTPGAYYVARADANAKLDTWISDASTSAKGKIKLANCLGGTADSPTVTAINAGGTILTFGSMTDGSPLTRHGTTITAP